MKIAIVLADDHRIMRQGLLALLSQEKDFRVIGEAGDGLEAVQTVERLKPDVLVVDLMMPGLNGLEVIRQVRKSSPSTRIVVLSMHKSEAYVWEALKNGAVAYVLKDCAAAELVKAVREAAAGRHFLSPPLSESAITTYLQKSRTGMLDLYDTLTRREREILQLSAEGKTSVAIGAQLSISPRTVEAHRANLMRKLGIHKQTELVRYALQKGIMPLPGP
jgi:two-component system, NarL family, response regulator NreC